MKLLFVGTVRGGGGTESHFVTLSRAMQAEGHSVAAVIRSESIIQNGLAGSAVKLYYGTFRNAFDPRGIIAVWHACRDFKPDWIIGNYSKEYWPLAIISRLLGIKLALFKHMDFPLRFVTHHFIPRLAHRFIVISNFMRANFIARGLAPERIQMLYNPLDLSHFHPDAALRKKTRSALGYKDDDVVLGFVGSFHRDKGMFQLAESANLAMEQLPNLKVLWIGMGPAKEEFVRNIQNNKFAHRHLCQPWSNDVRDYYAAMDILAIPSVSNEAFGRVSLEGQACGVPVLCSNRGGIPESLNPGVTGQLITSGDILAWRDAIIVLVKDEQLRHFMRNNGPEWVKEKFSSSAIAKQMTEMLQDLPVN